MKLKKKKLNKLKRIFKHRGNRTTKRLTLKFGSIGIYAMRTMRLEFTYLVMLRRLLKRLGKPKKKDKAPHKRLWFSIRSNYSITKKSKNARMGKGKGKFVRKNIIIPARFALVEFDGWFEKTIKFVCFRFKTKANLKFNYIIKNKKRSCTVCTNTNRSYELIHYYQA